MKIPYTLVSMAAILRDYDYPNYLNGEHYKLTSIADYLYNSADGAFSDHPEDNLLPEFKVIFNKYGADYFQKVIDDMYALDGQLTSDAKVQELIDDYNDRRLNGITASTRVTASINLIDKLGYIKNRNGKFDICLVETPFAEMELATYDPIEDEYDILTKVKDVADAYDQANKLFKTQDEYVINSSTRVTAATNYDTKLIAKWLKAKFDDEAFGTAYTMHRISDADAYMSRNGLTYNRRNNTIDLWKSGGDEDIPVYKVIPQYSSTKRQGTYAPKMPKLVPIDEWNATHGVTASTRVMTSRWYYYEPMTEQELSDLEADILSLPGCDRLDMDTRDMEEIGYIMLLPGYNDIPLSDPQYYEKRKQLLKDILRVAKEHGLSRTEDRIEDYGSCWYIVLRTNKPKTDEYDEYDY